MFDFPYIIELLSPRRDGGDKLDTFLHRFAERYASSFAKGCGISVPDNPMGQRRLSLLDCIETRNLEVIPEKVVMNLNTFHSKKELDNLLQRAIGLGIRNLLIIRGDGGPGLEKLDPADIGGKHSVTTTPDLLRYIHAEYAGHFNTGVAYNPYKNQAFELSHMQQKIEAGARFVITQPIVGKDENVDTLISQVNIPVIVEAWMSFNIELLYKSVGKKEDAKMATYDPLENIKKLHESYPNSCIYLALLSFRTEWSEILPQLANS